MRYLPFSLCLLLLLWQVFAAQAQQPDHKPKPTTQDSLLESQQKASQSLHERALVLQLQDSIRQERLRAEIRGMRAGDQQQIQELRQKLSLQRAQDSVRQAAIRQQVDSL